MTNFEAFRRAYLLYKLAPTRNPSDQAMVKRLARSLRIHENFGEDPHDVEVLEDTLLAYEQKVASFESELPELRSMKDHLMKRKPTPKTLRELELVEVAIEQNGDAVVVAAALQELAILLDRFEWDMLENGGNVSLATRAIFAHHSKTTPVWKLEIYYRHEEITNSLQSLVANYRKDLPKHVALWKIKHGIALSDQERTDYALDLDMTLGEWGMSSLNGSRTGLHFEGLASSGHVELLPRLTNNYHQSYIYKGAIRGGQIAVLEKYVSSLRGNVERVDYCISTSLEEGQLDVYRYLIEKYKGMGLYWGTHSLLNHVVYSNSLGFFRKMRHTKTLFPWKKRVDQYLDISDICLELLIRAVRARPNPEIIRYLLASMDPKSVGNINDDEDLENLMERAAMRGEYIITLITNGLAEKGYIIAPPPVV